MNSRPLTQTQRSAYFLDQDARLLRDADGHVRVTGFRLNQRSATRLAELTFRSMPTPWLLHFSGARFGYTSEILAKKAVHLRRVARLMTAPDRKAEVTATARECIKTARILAGRGYVRLDH